MELARWAEMYGDGTVGEEEQISKQETKRLGNRKLREREQNLWTAGGMRTWSMGNGDLNSHRLTG